MLGSTHYTVELVPAFKEVRSPRTPHPVENDVMVINKAC